MTTLWHNPRCSKSRQALALLAGNGHLPDIRLYLTDSPSQEEIQSAIDTLGISPPQLIRRSEGVYKELGLKGASDGALIAAMATHPILIERPIVFHNGRAAIGRPPEAVLNLF